MATKTITITTEAYAKLAMNKKENESFSDVISRLTAKSSLRQLAGILSKSQVDELEKNILESRIQFRKSLKRVV